MPPAEDATTLNCFSGQVSNASLTILKSLSVMNNNSPGLLVFYSALNMLLSLLSIGGNLAVMLTIAYFSELHITSNFGLGALAAANLLHGSTAHILLFATGVNICKGGCSLFEDSLGAFVHYISSACVYNSILSLLLVTLERYIGVVHSLHYYIILPRERMLKLVPAVWVSSLLFGAPYFSVVSTTFSSRFWLITFFALFALLFYCNIKLFFIARVHNRQVMSQLQAVGRMALGGQQRLRGARTVFLNLVSVVICYSPEIVVRSLAIGADPKTFSTLLNLSPWTAMFFVMHSSVTPFVYFFRSRELRRYTKKLLRKSLSFLSF